MKRTANKKTNGFLKLLIGVNSLLIVATLLSYFAPVTDPQRFWPIAFFGLAYPIMLPVHILFIVFWLFARPRYALLSVATLLIGWNILTATFGFRLPEKSTFIKPNGPTIRVLTYNVHYFRKFDDPTNSPLVREIMLSTMAQEKPDIICLQEIMTRKSGEFDNIAAIRKNSGLRYHQFLPNIDNSWEAQGLAIFSRYPILKTQSILFPGTSRGNEAMAIDVMAHGRKVRIYNVHFQSIGFQPEDYQYLKNVKEIQTDDVLSSKRIGSRLKRAFIQRSAQVKLIREHLDATTMPFVIAGDFNDTPASFAVNYVGRGLKNAFHQKGSGPGITYNGEFPNFQIDYILASDSFSVESYRVINKKLSDHYAVRSDLRLTP